MANISSIQRAFNNKILDSKILNKFIYKPASEDPARFGARMALASALTKDAVGCYYYVTQSLSNEKIPEDKRNFVAAIDLMNGILNVALQFSVGSWLDKKAPEMFKWFTNKKLDPNKTREIASKLSDTIKKEHSSENISMEQIEQFLRDKKVLGATGKTAKWLGVGFSAAVMLIATQVITKRVIVPFLSTPMAGWFKDNVLDKKEDPKKDKEFYQAVAIASSHLENKIDKTA